MGHRRKYVFHDLCSTTSFTMRVQGGHTTATFFSYKKCGAQKRERQKCGVGIVDAENLLDVTG